MLSELRELQGKLATSEAAARTAASRAAEAEGQLAQMTAEHEERERHFQSMRDEALAAVAYAWIRTQQIEERTKEQLEQAYAHWRDEEIHLQHHREQERDAWRVIIGGLRDRQLQALGRAEELARDLLDYVGTLRTRIDDNPAPGTESVAAAPPIDYYWQDAQPPPPSATAGEIDAVPTPTPFDPDRDVGSVGEQAADPGDAVRQRPDQSLDTLGQRVDTLPRPD